MSLPVYRYVMLLAIAALSACSSAPTPVSMQPSWSAANCNWQKPGVHSVRADQAKRLRTRQLLLEPRAPQTDQVHKQTASKQQATPQPSSPAAQNATTTLLVSKGSQPTPGYGFTWIGASADSGNLDIELSWQEPDPNSMRAQVITSPCLVVELPADTYQQVRVMDQYGEIGSIRP